MHRLCASAVMTAVCLALAVAAPLRAQAPLPAASEFLAAVRDNLVRAWRVQDQFAYKERRTQLHMNPFGRVGTGGTLVYDVTPVSDGPGFTRRLLERDGRPVHGEKVETFGGRRRRDRAQAPDAVQDTIAVLDFAIDRREIVNGRPFIVVNFSPKRGATPGTREGRLARSFTGQVWIDESAHEVSRVEANAIESISYGHGLIARLSPGAHATVLRAQVSGDVWLPVSVRFTGEGRALLLRKLNVDFSVEWFDYRPTS